MSNCFPLSFEKKYYVLAFDEVDEDFEGQLWFTSLHTETKFYPFKKFLMRDLH